VLSTYPMIARSELGATMARVSSGREQEETQRTFVVTPLQSGCLRPIQVHVAKEIRGDLVHRYSALFPIGTGATCADRRLLVRDVTWKRISTMHTNTTAQTYPASSRQLQLGTVRRQ
jgi:hypothetical protein